MAGASFAMLRANFNPSDTLESRRANRFQRKPRLRHQASFDPAFCSGEHDFSFPAPRHPFAGHGQRGEYVPARAASCNQQLHDQSACWLMFKRIPVANSITSRLDPP